MNTTMNVSMRVIKILASTAVCLLIAVAGLSMILLSKSEPALQADISSTMEKPAPEPVETWTVQSAVDNNAAIYASKDELKEIQRSLSLTISAIEKINAQLEHRQSVEPQRMSAQPPTAVAEEHVQKQDELYDVALTDSIEEIILDEKYSSGVNTELESSIYDTLVSIPVTSSIDNIVCGDSFCKAEISHSDAESHTKIMDDFISGKLAWDGPIFIRQAVVSGADLSLVYMGKADTELPTIDLPEPTIFN